MIVLRVKKYIDDSIEVTRVNKNYTVKKVSKSDKGKVK